MRQNTRAAMVITTGVLALGASGLAPALASHAAPSRSCSYPPGSCSIAFNHHNYHRGATVSFHTGRAFHKSESLSGHLHCRHHYNRSEGPFQAHHHHGSGSFHLSKHTPKGTCTFTLTGDSSGNTASGSFNVTS
jgi:hypothetical protein